MLVVSFASSDFEADQRCCLRWSPHLRTTWWWYGGENPMRYISSFVILVACHMARTIRINMIGSRDHRSWTLSSFKLVSRIVRGPTQAGIIPPMSENSSTAVLVSLIQSIQVTVPQGATRISSLSQHFLFTGFLTYRGETGLRSTCANFDCARDARNITFNSFANPQEVRVWRKVDFRWIQTRPFRILGDLWM